MDPLQQLITTWAIVFIACAAFFVSCWQVYATRRHNMLSVTPQIGFALYTIPGTFGIQIKNYGIGPAIIEKFSIKINNIEMYQDLMVGNAEIFSREIGLPDIEFNITCVEIGTYILPGHSFYIFEYADSESVTKEVCERVTKGLQKIDIFMNYQSIYQEKFEEEF